MGAPLTLLHELGHALVAVRRLRSRVDVVVGTRRHVARVQLGRIQLALSAWAPLAGVARHREHRRLRGAGASVINLLSLETDGSRTDGRLALDALRAVRMAPPRRERRRSGGPIAPGSPRARLQSVYVGFLIVAVVFAVGIDVIGRY